MYIARWASAMRALLTIFVLLLASPYSHAEDDPNYLYAITFTGGFTMTRYAKADYVEAQRKTRPDCIVVNWSYVAAAGDTEDALKSARDNADAAVSAELARDPTAMVAAKSLTADTTLWIICTSAGQEFEVGVHRQLDNLSNSKFKLRLARDPEWSVLSDYVKRLREKK